MKFLVCANGHTHSTQEWTPASQVPTRCLFGPCGAPFLTPGQLGALTRQLNRKGHA